MHAALIVGADRATWHFHGLGRYIERNPHREAFDRNRFGFDAGVRLERLLIAECVDDFLHDRDR